MLLKHNATRPFPSPLKSAPSIRSKHLIAAFAKCLLFPAHIAAYVRAGLFLLHPFNDICA